MTKLINVNKDKERMNGHIQMRENKLRKLMSTNGLGRLNNKNFLEETDEFNRLWI